MFGKKIHIIWVAALIWLSLTSVGEAATIKVFIDGSEQSYDQQPILQNGRVLVPLRGIFESLHAGVVYDKETKEIHATKGNINVWLTIGSKQTKVNAQTIILETPAKVKAGRVFVPLRFIGESLGCSVEWDHVNQKVMITIPKQVKDQTDEPAKEIPIGDPVKVEIDSTISVMVESEDATIKEGIDKDTFIIE